MRSNSPKKTINAVDWYNSHSQASGAIYKNIKVELRGTKTNPLPVCDIKYNTATKAKKNSKSVERYYKHNQDLDFNLTKGDLCDARSDIKSSDSDEPSI